MRLDQVLALPAVAALKPEPRTRRVHHDWLEAGEHTQRTVAQLSQQLRRFLDDRAFLENRRILDLLHGVESKALGCAGRPPAGNVMSIDAMGADIELPLERPLFTPSVKPRLADLALETSGEDIDTARLFDQIVVDKARLAEGIQRALRPSRRSRCATCCDAEPLHHGLAELVAYLELAHAGTARCAGWDACRRGRSRGGGDPLAGMQRSGRTGDARSASAPRDLHALKARRRQQGE